MKSICNKCSRNVTDKRFPGLSCASCSKIYHQNCAGISKEAFNGVATKDFAWSCSSCKNKPTTRKSGIFPQDLPINPRKSLIPPPTSTSKSDQQLEPSIEKSLHSLTQAFNSYKETTDARIALLEKQLEIKSNQVALLSSQIEKVDQKADDSSKAIFEDSLEILGIPNTLQEDPATAVLRVSQEIECELEADEIECSLTQTVSKPTVIIKFKSKARRAEFYKAGKKFNRDRKLLTHGTTKHKIFINERLTTDQKRLLHNTKSFARNCDFDFAWFCNGLIHLKKRSNSRVIYIRTQDDLDLLANNETQDLLPERPGAQIQDERAPPMRRI